MPDLTSSLQRLCGSTVEIKQVMETHDNQWIILFVPPTWEERPMPELGPNAKAKPTTMIKASTPFEALAELVDQIKYPRPQAKAHG